MVNNIVMIIYTDNFGSFENIRKYVCCVGVELLGVPLIFQIKANYISVL